MDMSSSSFYAGFSAVFAVLVIMVSFVVVAMYEEDLEPAKKTS